MGPNPETPTVVDETIQHAPPSALVVGTTLGRYIVVSRIGEGGMGEVVRAYDPKLQREVAIKRLHTGKLDPEGEARLMREAQAMAQLSHPNVVSVYDVDRTEYGVVLAMELVEGETLRDWIRREHRVSEILEMMAQAGRGLEAAHAIELVHRDFKPANVLCGRQGQIKVTDFGLARPREASDSDEPSARVLREHDLPDSLSSPVTHHGATLGTPAYMAPEQHGDSSPDPRSDQFAFCVTTWEALYGSRPFKGTRIQMALSKREGPPPPPSPSRVPRRIYDILARGLAHEPEDRWPSMTVLLEALLDDPARRRTRRIATAAVAATLVGVGAVATRSVDEAEEICPDPSEELAGVWDEARAAEVDDALRALAVPYAADTADRVAAGLDQYAQAWVASKRDACEATHVRREQSDTLLDRRTTCLAHRHQSLSAAATVLAAADAEVAERATELVDSLPPLAPCSDADALLAAYPPPEDPDVAAAVEDGFEKIATARAEVDAAQFETAIAMLDALVEQADALGYPPLMLHARHARGIALKNSGNYEGAGADFELAYQHGVLTDEVTLTVDTAIALAFVTGVNGTRSEAAEIWAAAAKAQAARIDPNGLYAARALDTTAVLAYKQGNYAVAADRAQAAKDMLAQLPEHQQSTTMANVLNHLGAAQDELQRYAEAEANFRHAVEIDEAFYGSDHPKLAGKLGNLAVNLQMQQRYPDALVIQRRVLDLRERTLGADHPATSLTRVNTAWTMLELGDHAEARDAFRVAYDDMVAKMGKEHPRVAMTLEGLGTAAYRMGQHETAEAHHREALAIRKATVGEDHPNVALSWLALGGVIAAAGRLEEALDAFDEALRVLADRGDDVKRIRVDVHEQRGVALANAGQLGRAREDFERAMALLGDPPDPPERAKSIARQLDQLKAQLAAGD